MNLYFLLEGKTEMKVYPPWLCYLAPGLKRVQIAGDADLDNYYMISGFGYPSLLYNHLANSIEEVNELGIYDYLVIVADADESTYEERFQEIKDFVRNKNLTLVNTELVVIIQNRCIETWFLGNKKIFRKNVQNKELAEYIKFYNVKENDPEKMGCYKNCPTHSQFHYKYCSLFLAERNISYTKTNPHGVTEKNYLDNLIRRTETTGHLQSLGKFIDFCKGVSEQTSKRE